MTVAENLQPKDGEQEREQDEQEQVSSVILVEFEGVGMADIRGARIQNITLGQMLVFAQWAQWQADKMIAQHELAKAQKQAQSDALNKILVPPGIVPQ